MSIALLSSVTILLRTQQGILLLTTSIVKTRGDSLHITETGMRTCAEWALGVLI